MARKRDVTETTGGKALAWLVDATNPARVSQSRVAQKLGVSQPSVSEWVRMRSRPEPHLRKAIESHFQIPEQDWMTPKEQAYVAKQAALAAEDTRDANARSVPPPESGTDVAAEAKAAG